MATILTVTRGTLAFPRDTQHHNAWRKENIQSSTSCATLMCTGPEQIAFSLSQGHWRCTGNRLHSNLSIMSWVWERRINPPTRPPRNEPRQLWLIADLWICLFARDRDKSVDLSLADCGEISGALSHRPSQISGCVAELHGSVELNWEEVGCGWERCLHFFDHLDCKLIMSSGGKRLSTFTQVLFLGKTFW